MNKSAKYPNLLASAPALSPTEKNSPFPVRNDPTEPRQLLLSPRRSSHHTNAPPRPLDLAPDDLERPVLAPVDPGVGEEGVGDGGGVGERGAGEGVGRWERHGEGE